MEPCWGLLGAVLGRSVGPTGSSSGPLANVAPPGLSRGSLGLSEGPRGPTWPWEGPRKVKKLGAKKGSLLREPSWRALGLSDGFGKGRSGRWEGPEKIQQRLPEGAPKKPKRNKIKYFIWFRLVLVFK